MPTLNTNYLTSNRGLIKIIQIVLGFIICSLLCVTTWSGRQTCFYEGRIGSVSGYNFVILIINVVLLILNFVNIASWKLERLYSSVACVLFLICALLVVWFIIVHEDNRGFMIATVALLIVQFLVFMWDVKILQGESPN